MQVDNVVSCQEVSSILGHVQQAIEEHKNMMKVAEAYFEQNGMKKEYDEYLESRLAEVKAKKEKRDISKVKQTEKESVKKVNRTRGR